MYDDDEERPSKKRKGSKTHTTKASPGGERGRGWNSRMGESSGPAGYKAYEAALKCARELTNPAAAKVLTASANSL
jgi:hypothetical protein